MPILRNVLRKIARASYSHPKTVIALFGFLAVLGFAAMPHITISSNLMAGVGQDSPVIRLARESIELFGEQDSLILVVEFPEAPGPERLSFMRGLETLIRGMPRVRHVRSQFLDIQDGKHVESVLQNFLLGLNDSERRAVADIFSPEALEGALTRNRNRLFLAEDPLVQKRILEDPFELGHFVLKAMKKRLGAVSLGDMFLLIGSPDSTVYLVQVTPDFPSSDIGKARELIRLLRESIPNEISRLADEVPELGRYRDDIRWSLTGKTLFHYESDQVFRRENYRILFISVGLVSLLLLIMYRSIWSGIILMAPIAAGIGPNYGLMWLIFEDVNPVVMAAAGVLFGLSADYGVHLWTGLREELEKDSSLLNAVTGVYERTGPPVLLGAITTILAFLCMCFSRQPAMAQFGLVGASGLILSLCSTLWLFPALVSVVGTRNRELLPRMRLSLQGFSRLYQRRPRPVALLSVLVIALGAFGASHVKCEPDLYKVFLARNLESMEVSNFIARKFRVSFGQPVLLFFETPDFEEGLQMQREIDGILGGLMAVNKDIATADSISYLQAPQSVKKDNVQWIGEIAEAWPSLSESYQKLLGDSDLSDSSISVINGSFHAMGALLKRLATSGLSTTTPVTEMEQTWYVAKVKDRYRFLTQVRYLFTKTDPKELSAIDKAIVEGLQGLPLPVTMTGPRQAMGEVLSSLVGELIRIGVYVVIVVIVFFVVVFRRPLGVALSLVPMLGAFAITLGVMALLGLGLPFSVVGVAPLIFGLGMDNGVHVVMGSMSRRRGAVDETMQRVTAPIIFTSVTNVAGFVAMLSSRLYAMEFLGWAMIIAMTASVSLTLTALPAFLLLLERRRSGHDTIPPAE